MNEIDQILINLDETLKNDAKSFENAQQNIRALIDRKNKVTVHLNEISRLYGVLKDEIAEQKKMRQDIEVLKETVQKRLKDLDDARQEYKNYSDKLQGRLDSLEGEYEELDRQKKFFEKKSAELIRKESECNFKMADLKKKTTELEKLKESTDKFRRELLAREKKMEMLHGKK